MKDYYQILGVDRKASDADIKRAYRKLASQHHPDRGGDSDKFKEVQEAYDILSDPSARASYDNPHGFFTQRTNFDDILNQYFTQFRTASPDRQMRMTVWVSLQDIYTGTKKVISLNTGNGAKMLEIDVPQGTHDNENVRYDNLLGPNTSLIINYRIHPDNNWTRNAMDLYTTIKLDFWQLICGCETEFKGLAGNTYSLKINPKSKPGTTMRLSNQGFSRKGHNNGDLFVKIEAVLPDQIPKEIEDIITSMQLNK